MPTSTPWDDLRNQTAVRWLRERDIDLLVCSELHLDGGPLQEILVGGWNSNGVTRFDGAVVSHWDAGDETDIVASFKSDSGSLVLLIENKIDADFQPDQPQRYRERAQRGRDSGPPTCEVETVLLAPSGYFENEGREIFDRQVSYEEVIDALAESTDPRTLFLADTLRNGIESHRQGYRPEHDEATTQAWNAFWEMANAETPLLRMGKPGSKPSGAGFIEFQDAEGVSVAETGRRAKIIYKRRHCNVDLQFANMSEAALRSAVEGLLEPDMAVMRTGKSASIRIGVPPVDFTRMPNGQGESIRAGLQAAERLRRWFVEKRLLEVVLGA